MPFPTPVKTKRIIMLHNEGLSCKEIFHNVGKIISVVAIYKRLYKLGIRPNVKRCKFNELFFSNINTEAKAYWLGFIFADGCVIRRKYGNKNLIALRIGLSYRDNDHLELFLKDIESSNAIAYCGNGNECRVSLNSDRLVKDLENLGCVKRKSLKLTKLPDMPDKLVRHFIRGYFDGDGCISFQNAKRRIKGGVQKRNAKLLFVGTRKFLQALRQIFAHNGVWFTDPIQRGNIFYLYGNGNQKAKLFYNYIYRGSRRFLLRKKERFYAIL